MGGYGLTTSMVACYQELVAATRELAASVAVDHESGLASLLWQTPPDQMPILGPPNHPWLDGVLRTHPERVSLALNQLSYIPQQSPQGTLVFPGVVMCSRKTKSLVELVNVAKLNFKDSVLAIKAENNDESQSMSSNTRHIKLREVFSAAGIGSICLKHAYRPVHVFDATSTATLQFYLKVKTASVKASAAEEIEALNKPNLKFSDQEKAVLARKIAGAGRVFSKVGNKCSVVTANILLDDCVRRQAAGVLPIFICMPQDGKLLADFSSLEKPGETDKKSVAPRSIDPQYFGHMKGFTLHARIPGKKLDHRRLRGDATTVPS